MKVSLNEKFNMLQPYEGNINKDNIIFYNYSKINFIHPNGNRNISIDRV